MQNKILEITTKSVQEKWAFPKTFKELKNTGLTTYVIEVPTFKMTYNWNGGSFVKNNPMTFNVTGQFTPEKIKQAIDVHNRDKTTFLDFMNDIATKGCTHYVVEFDNNQVVYYNADESLKHVEKVPGF